MRLPPIAWAGIVAVVVLGLAITVGLLTGPGPSCAPSPGAPASAASSVGATASPTPTACATASPSATP